MKGKSSAAYMHEWGLRRAAQKAAAGICRTNGCTRRVNGTVSCDSCRERIAARNRSRRERLAAYGMCTECGQNQTNGTRCRRCLDLKAESARRRSLEVPTKVRKRWRKYALRKYGLTESEFEAMKLSQGGLCAVCRGHPSRQDLAVDHNHHTGRVRGLLCEKCNIAAGLLRDSSATVLALHAYLRRFEDDGESQNVELGEFVGLA